MDRKFVDQEKRELQILDLKRATSAFQGELYGLGLSTTKECELIKDPC